MTIIKILTGVGPVPHLRNKISFLTSASQQENGTLISILNEMRPRPNKRRNYLQHASRCLLQSNPKSVNKEKFQILICVSITLLLVAIFDNFLTSVLLATFQLPAPPVWPPVTTSLIVSPTVYLVNTLTISLTNATSPTCRMHAWSAPSGVVATALRRNSLRVWSIL